MKKKLIAIISLVFLGIITSQKVEAVLPDIDYYSVYGNNVNDYIINPDNPRYAKNMNGLELDLTDKITILKYRGTNLVADTYVGTKQITGKGIYLVPMGSSVTIKNMGVLNGRIVKVQMYMNVDAQFNAKKEVEDGEALMNFQFRDKGNVDGKNPQVMMFVKYQDDNTYVTDYTGGSYLFGVEERTGFKFASANTYPYASKAIVGNTPDDETLKEYFYTRRDPWTITYRTTASKNPNDNKISVFKYSMLMPANIGQNIGIAMDSPKWAYSVLDLFSSSDETITVPLAYDDGSITGIGKENGDLDFKLKANLHDHNVTAYNAEKLTFDFAKAGKNAEFAGLSLKDIVVTTTSGKQVKPEDYTAEAGKIFFNNEILEQLKGEELVIDGSMTVDYAHTDMLAKHFNQTTKKFDFDLNPDVLVSRLDIIDKLETTLSGKVSTTYPLEFTAEAANVVPTIGESTADYDIIDMLKSITSNFPGDSGTAAFKGVTNFTTSGRQDIPITITSNLLGIAKDNVLTVNVNEFPKWGTSFWNFNESTGVLSIKEGTLGTSDSSPWNRKDKFKLDPTKIKKIDIVDKVVAPSDGSYLFSGETVTNQAVKLNNLTEITNLANLDTSKTTSMKGMFAGNVSLTSVDVKEMSTGAVTDMSGMFKGTSKLASIKGLTELEMNSVENLESFLAFNTSLTTIDLSKWNTGALINIASIFEGTTLTEVIGLSELKTSTITTIDRMFMNNQSIESLDLSQWSTEALSTMAEAFQGMSNLKKLNLKNWNTLTLRSMENVFKDATKLNELTIGKDFQFKETPGLREVPNDSIYTGQWSSLGKGSLAHPTGETVKTTSALLADYDGKTMADTFVWRPKLASDLKVIYVDEAGKSLAMLVPDKIIKEKEVDQPYDVRDDVYKPKVKNFELDKKQLPKNSKGVYSHKDIVVKYVYRKIDKDLIGEGPYSSQLSFTWAPKSFNLGRRTPVIIGNRFDLDSNSKDKQWIVVNENRADNDSKYGSHWSVTAKMGILTAEDGDYVEGAKLFMNLNKLQKYEMGEIQNATGTDLVPQNPNDKGVVTDFTERVDDIQLAQGLAGLEKQPLELIGDGITETNVMSQNENRSEDFKKREGYATHVSEQRLVIPYFDMNKLKEAPKGKFYNTKITWTLARDF